MLPILIVILFAVLGIGLGVLFSVFVVKKFPKLYRIAGYVKTVVIFLLTAAVLSALVQGKFIADSIIDEHSTQITEEINTRHPNNPFVRDGIDLSRIGDDAAVLNAAMASIREVLPSHTELGVSLRLYNFAVNPLLRQLQSALTTIDGSADTNNPFTDENNILTVSSLVDGMQRGVTQTINIILIVIGSIFILIFAIHVIKSLIVVSKEKKRIMEMGEEQADTQPTNTDAEPTSE